MKVHHYYHQEISPTETQELEKLKTLIKRVIADGILTNEEMQSIKAAIIADKKVTVEELTLIRNMIDDKIASGELQKDWE